MMEAGGGPKGRFMTVEIGRGLEIEDELKESEGPKAKRTAGVGLCH